MTADARSGYRVVPLTREHAADILRIFNEHVVGGFAAYPETPVSEAFVDGLLRSAAGFPARVAEVDGGDVVGFGLLRPYSPVPVFAHTAVVTIFLTAEWVGRGVGTAILCQMLQEAPPLGLTRILAHVSSKNPRSLAFHRKQGFVECGWFPGIGRKWGEAFDVVWMVKALDPSEGA